MMNRKFSPSTASPIKEQAIVLSENLQKLYKERVLYDVILVAGLDNFRIEAHRLVLSASSDVFLAMFCNPLKEAKAEEVMLDIDGTTLKVLLDFIYTISIQLTSETVEKVLRAAHLYQVKTLIPVCCNFMQQQLDTTNCLGIAFLAEQYECTTLYQKAIAFAANNFQEVCTKSQFFNINEEQLKKFISSTDIRVRSLLNNVLSWIEHDVENREKLAFSLMSYLNTMKVPDDDDY